VLSFVCFQVLQKLIGPVLLNYHFSDSRRNSSVETKTLDTNSLQITTVILTHKLSQSTSTQKITLSTGMRQQSSPVSLTELHCGSGRLSRFARTAKASWTETRAPTSWVISTTNYCFPCGRQVGSSHSEEGSSCCRNANSLWVNNIMVVICSNLISIIFQVQWGFTLLVSALLLTGFIHTLLHSYATRAVVSDEEKLHVEQIHDFAEPAKMKQFFQHDIFNGSLAQANSYWSTDVKFQMPTFSVDILSLVGVIALIKVSTCTLIFMVCWQEQHLTCYKTCSVKGSHIGDTTQPGEVPWKKPVKWKPNSCVFLHSTADTAAQNGHTEVAQLLHVAELISQSKIIVQTSINAVLSAFRSPRSRYKD